MSPELLTTDITVLDVRVRKTNEGFVCTAHAGTRRLALTQYSHTASEPSIEAALKNLARQLEGCQ